MGEFIGIGATDVAALQAQVDELEADFDAATGNRVFVESLSDLPAPSGGVITLADTNTTYYVTRQVDITPNRLDAPSGAAIVGIDDVNCGFTTANAGALITAAGNFKLNRLTLFNPLGKTIEYSGGGTGIMIIRNMLLINGATDTATAAFATVLLNAGWRGAQGIEFSGALSSILVRDALFQITGSGASCFTIASGTTIDNADIQSSQFFLSSGQFGVDIDSGVIPTNEGQISLCIFDGAGSPLEPTGIDQTTLGWNIMASPGIEDSARIGQIGFSGNATVTDIAAVGSGVYTTIATGVAYSLEAASERFQLETVTSRQLEYLGKEDIRAQVTASLTIEGATNNKVFEGRVLHNGAEIAAVDLDYRNTPIGRLISTIASVSQDDTFEVQIRNNTDATNVTVSALTLSAIKAG